MNETKTWRDFKSDFAAPTVLLFLFLVGGHLATWWLVLEAGLPLWIGLVLQTFHAYLAFTPLHEAVHGNIGGTSQRAWIDETIGWICGALLMAPYPAFKVLHLTHHSHTNDPERDPDHWVAGSGAIPVLLRCLSIVPRYLIDYFAGQTSKTKSARTSRRVSILFFVGLGLALALLVSLGLVIEVLALFVVPAVLASGLLAFAFDWLPHHPHRVQGRYVDTRVVLFWGLGVATLGQSYHTVHHLYPRVPFYRYASCFHAIRGELETNRSPVVDLRFGRGAQR